MMENRNSENKIPFLRSRFVLTGTLLASCGLVMASPSPVAAQRDGYALPHDPFQRLLAHLDHAPFDLDKAEASAKRGSSMQQTGAAYRAAIAPVIPVLETVNKSKAMAFLGHLPFVGKRFEMAQSGIETASELGDGFVHLVDLDKSHIQPLREAVLLSAHLRRSRRREDLPATVESLDNAVKPLTNFEAFGEEQDKRLTSYIKDLEVINERHFANRAGKQQDSKTVKNAVAKLQRVDARLEAETAEIRKIRLYTETCAADGHAALRTSGKEYSTAEQGDARL